MSISRRRLSPEESRSAALDAARELLLDRGTVRRSRSRLSRRRSAAPMPTCSTISARPPASRPSSPARSPTRSLRASPRPSSGPAPARADARDIVDQTFDAFGKRRRRRARRVDDPHRQPRRAEPDPRIRSAASSPSSASATRSIMSPRPPCRWCLTALGDALLGPPIRRALWAVAQDAAREARRRPLARAPRTISPSDDRERSTVAPDRHLVQSPAMGAGSTTTRDRLEPASSSSKRISVPAS